MSELFMPTAVLISDKFLDVTVPVLKRAGYEVHIAKNYSQGAMLAVNMRPHIIFVDLSVGNHPLLKEAFAALKRVPFSDVVLCGPTARIAHFQTRNKFPADGFIRYPFPSANAIQELLAGIRAAKRP